MRQSSTLVNDVRGDSFYGGGDNGDAIEAHEWKCVRTINGMLAGNLYSFDIKQSTHYKLFIQRTRNAPVECPHLVSSTNFALNVFSWFLLLTLYTSPSVIHMCFYKT